MSSIIIASQSQTHRNKQNDRHLITTVYRPDQRNQNALERNTRLRIAIQRKKQKQKGRYKHMNLNQSQPGCLSTRTIEKTIERLISEGMFVLITTFILNELILGPIWLASSRFYQFKSLVFRLFRMHIGRSNQIVILRLFCTDSSFIILAIALTKKKNGPRIIYFLQDKRLYVNGCSLCLFVKFSVFV